MIVVEGQGALSHPAYLTSAHILRGSRPAGVIVQHAPKRGCSATSRWCRCRRPPARSRLIEAFADTKVIGLTINHEHMSDDEVSAAIVAYELELGVPATDPLTRPLDRLVDMVLLAFPDARAALAHRTAVRRERSPSRGRPRGGAPQRQSPRGRARAPGHPGHRHHQGGPGVDRGRRRHARRRGRRPRRLPRREPRPRCAGTAVAAPLTLIRSPMLEPGRHGRAERRRQPEHRARRARGASAAAATRHGVDARRRR